MLNIGSYLTYADILTIIINIDSGTIGPGTIGPGTIGPGTIGPGTIGPGTIGPGIIGPGTTGSVILNCELEPERLTEPNHFTGYDTNESIRCCCNSMCHAYWSIRVLYHSSKYMLEGYDYYMPQYYNVCIYHYLYIIYYIAAEVRPTCS